MTKVTKMIDGQVMTFDVNKKAMKKHSKNQKWAVVEMTTNDGVRLDAVAMPGSITRDFADRKVTHVRCADDTTLFIDMMTMEVVFIREH